jgi:hypothetical protein
MLAVKESCLQLFSIADLRNELVNKNVICNIKYGTNLKIPEVNVQNIPSSTKSLHQV